MRLRAIPILAAAAVVAALPASAGAATKQVTARGSDFPPLPFGYDPDDVTARVGQIVRWTARDADHSATEDHGLWDLGGFYGFPQNSSRQRPFEAGTHNYYCQVHGAEAMSGVVRVPVRLSISGDPARVRARWADDTPASGLVFDVQRRKDGGDWVYLARNTRDIRDSFGAGAEGTRWRMRARLKDASTPSDRTGWSPVASVTN